MTENQHDILVKMKQGAWIRYFKRQHIRYVLQINNVQSIKLSEKDAIDLINNKRVVLIKDKFTHDDYIYIS